MGAHVDTSVLLQILKRTVPPHRVSASGFYCLKCAGSVWTTIMGGGVCFVKCDFSWFNMTSKTKWPVILKTKSECPLLLDYHTNMRLTCLQTAGTVVRGVTVVVSWLSPVSAASWRKCHGWPQHWAAIPSAAEQCSVIWMHPRTPSVCAVMPPKWWSQAAISSRSMHWRKSSLWRSWISASAVNPRSTSAVLMWCGTKWKRTCLPLLLQMGQLSPGTWGSPLVISRTSCLLSTNAPSTRCVFTPQRFTCFWVAHRMASWSALTYARRNLSVPSQVGK